MLHRSPTCTRPGSAGCQTPTAAQTRGSYRLLHRLPSGRRFSSCAIWLSSVSSAPIAPSTKMKTTVHRDQPRHCLYLPMKHSSSLLQSERNNLIYKLSSRHQLSRGDEKGSLLSDHLFTSLPEALHPPSCLAPHLPFVS